ncbi:ketimine reductase mu-crystallin [Leptinotarsa decemlineata]|uniref:ketimine reductase mu-crystallin n=1 Tax=Leptinotarsa decemlineata TaxID=7539 RepID=UPI003D304A86
MTFESLFTLNLLNSRPKKYFVTLIICFVLQENILSLSLRAPYQNSIKGEYLIDVFIPQFTAWRKIQNMIYIDEETVLSLINWDKTFKAMEVAMKRVTEGRVVQSARGRTKIFDKPDILLTMPGYLEDGEFGALGCKIVTFFPGNVELKTPLPSVNANIMLFDENTGIIKGIVAGTEITKWRTAAASAVATKYIHAKKLASSKILAIVGAGEQGKVHAECFKHFFDFQEVRIWNRTPSRAHSLAEYLNKKYNTNIYKVNVSVEECVKEADVIVSSTNSSVPVLMADWIKAGAHINAVGAGKTHHSEVQEKLYFQSDVYIDHWEGAKTELAGLEKAGVKFKGEVGGVIRGDIKTEDENKITIFQSLGMGVEDCAMARLIFDLYESKNTKM